VQNSGPPVEYGDEELLMVKQLQWWWRRSLEKGKGKQIVSNGSDEKGTKVNGNKKGNANGASRGKAKNKARRGGKKVNINRG
jgi:hypothetical protein